MLCSQRLKIVRKMSDFHSIFGAKIVSQIRTFIICWQIKLLTLALQSSIFVVWKTCKLCHEFIDACKFSFMFFCIKNDVSKEGGGFFPFLYFRPDDKFFPIVGFAGFATYQKKQLDYNSMTKPFIIVVCQNSLMISSKAMREWARKIVVILHHTKDIRKLSYEKEKARNSVQWYGIWPMGPKGIVLSLFYCIENEDLRKPENAKNVKPFDVANRQWLVQGSSTILSRQTVGV